MFGIVIMSAIGTAFGYLLEPGRFQKRDPAGLALNPTSAHPIRMPGMVRRSWPRREVNR